MIEFKENMKLLVWHLFKTYEPMVVSKEAFENSDDLESVGYVDGFKIKCEGHLKFMVNELNKKGYKEIRFKGGE